jgi:VIT1/CCC1 family predicted Fe2+/Mn2+ transporter
LKIYACIIIAILAVAVWLYVVGNISKFEFPLIVVGCMFITFLTAYIVFVLGIVAYEQAGEI